MFKVDENLPVEVAEVMRERALDAVTVRDQQLLGCSDELLAGICGREGRTVVTLDLGFARSLGAWPAPHAGLVILRPKRPDRTSIIRLATLVARNLPSSALRGEIWIVNETRIRVRSGLVP